MIRIKKFLNVIDDLRNTGNLDKNKWRQTRETICTFIIIITAFILFVIISSVKRHDVVNPIIVFTIGGGFLAFFVKNITEKFLLYNIGHKATAEVIFGRLYQGRGKWYLFDYFYYSDDGNKHFKGEERNYMTLKGTMETPQVGEKIDILYLNQEPKISIMYNQESNRKYNLRKNQ